jgi:D-alanyl-D-alanine dipeptidase
MAIQAQTSRVSPLPEGFSYLEEIIPNIRIELHYYAENNFIGAPIDGYLAPKGIMTTKAAHALKKVQAALQPFGLGLKIFDAYRPQPAVDHFVRWAEDLSDTLMKATYYPDVKKQHLFNAGYISARSGHSRGSTVDLTIISLKERRAGDELDMGSPYDFFGVESWPDHAELLPEQSAYRLLLKTLMVQHGFNPYDKEWWHFTLSHEPFPDTYFNFPVR